MTRSDQLNAPPVHTREEMSPVRSSDGRADRMEASARALPMLWRVFAANAAVFAVAFALLALSPVTIHARIRLLELVTLLAGLIVMLAVDLFLLHQALGPLGRLSRVMHTIDLLRPGQRATGFEHSSREVLGLADAFNEMLDRLEAERRESSARVLSAQEEERVRIARELHDEIGQTLTAVALRAEHTAHQAGDQHPEFAELAELVQQALVDVRRISLELRPGALDGLGLINALISLCTHVSDQGGIHVHRELTGPAPEMPPDVELAIYRIVQEALTNATRHSHATDATVSLSLTEQHLVLSITDNGLGMPEHLTAGGGLAGIRERAMLIGAQLEITSVAGTGVSVILRLPLGQERL